MNSNNYDTHAERGSLSDFDKSGKRDFSPKFNQPRSKSKLWLWIILGLVLVSGLGLGIYFFTKSSDNSPTKNPNNPNIQYLPSQQEAQTKISQIQQAKGLDEQQATIEFLTAYVSHIKWWEINSLEELDEKIKLVNDKTSFPPFSEIPAVDKFNEEVEGNLKNKSLLFLASIVPRESDGSIDWKGLDFLTYLTTVLQPQMEQIKFKSSFATQANYQELAQRLTQKINTDLSSTCSKFSTLNNVSELNQLTNEYLSKIFQGYIYAEAIHDELGKQLGVANHQKFKLDKTGNHSLNNGWNIALNEFVFKGGSEPNPDPSGNEYQLLEKDLKFVYDKFINIKERKEHEDPDLKWLNQLSFNSWMCFEQDQVNGLPKIEKLQSELSSHTNDKTWLTQTRTNIRQKYDWLFKNFQNKEEALDFLKNNEHRFKYVNKIWQN